MAAPVDVGGGRSRVITLSIGAAELRPPRGEQDLKALAHRLLADADAALYRAKAAGRDRVIASGGAG
jgi:two-component system cell cycle response regulator